MTDATRSRRHGRRARHPHALGTSRSTCIRSSAGGMVDWVIDAAGAARRRPLVVVTSPDTRDAFDGRRGRRPGRAARHRRRRRARLATRSTGFDGDVLVLSGDTPLLTAELLAGARRRRTGASGAAATVLTFEPDRSAAVRPDRPRRDGDVARDRRGARRDRRAAGDRRGQLLDLRLRRRTALAGARAARRRTTRRASST